MNPCNLRWFVHMKKYLQIFRLENVIRKQKLRVKKIEENLRRIENRFKEKTCRCGTNENLTQNPMQ